MVRKIAKGYYGIFVSKRAIVENAKLREAVAEGFRSSVKEHPPESDEQSTKANSKSLGAGAKS
jgi:hypothetical protein